MEKELKAKLEKEGEQKVIAIMSDKNAKITSNTFTGIIKEGAKEFEEKLRRPMTYSEMRGMFG